MPGLVPGIHVFMLGKDVDGRATLAALAARPAMTLRVTSPATTASLTLPLRRHPEVRAKRASKGDGLGRADHPSRRLASLGSSG